MIWFAAAITITVFTFSQGLNPLANLVMSILLGALGSFVIYVLVIHGNTKRQMVSNGLLLTALIGFLVVPMMPDPSAMDWLFMLVACPILAFISHLFDQTGRGR